MKIRPAAIAALTLTAVLTFTGCAGGTGSGDDMDGMDHGGSSSAPAETADANEVDIMFARMMIEHHTQAVDMSDTILGKEGIDEQVTALAEDIKAAQQPEIEKMESWLQDWDAADTDTGEMDHGGGMMTEEDMQALDDATGVEASRLFLEQMIEHHNGAIDMAQDEIDNGQNSDAVNLAQTIVDTQTAEITTMEEILAIL